MLHYSVFYLYENFYSSFLQKIDTLKVKIILNYQHFLENSFLVLTKAAIESLQGGAVEVQNIPRRHLGLQVDVFLSLAFAIVVTTTVAFTITTIIIYLINLASTKDAVDELLVVRHHNNSALEVRDGLGE